MKQALLELAHFYGIETSYHNVMGQHVHASPEALVYVLQRLGAFIEREDEAPEALRAAQLEACQWALPPVVVAWDGKATLPLCAPKSAASHKASWSIHTEEGEVLKGSKALASAPVVAAEEREGQSFLRWEIPLPHALPTGYHPLTLEWGGERVETTVISAPQRVYVPWVSPRERYWGVFLPLYALHREGSSRTAHLGDLQELMQWVEGEGGHLVGTLPLLAAFLDQPCEPSPYTPASRLFWNEFYLDLQAIPEWADSPEAQAALERQPDALPHRPGYSPVDLQRGPFGPNEVHHYAQMQQTRAALEALSRRFFASKDGRDEAFTQWRRRHPHVEAYAQFRATQEQQAAPWTAWPEALQRRPQVTGELQDAAQYHLYVQWNLHQQLEALSKSSGEDSLGLYLDLPLGVHPHGFDTWRYPHAFCHGMATGAPPDALQIRGQNWGFPPLHPRQLREHKYDYLIDTYRNHMQYAGVLRIDHVMGLYRLFAIPDGMDATEGLYIRFAQDELYAILSLESQRNRCLLLGEDLGTVPDAVRQAMERHEVQRMHVVQFAMSPDADDALRPPPAKSVASLNTHDTPTFAGFWRGQDLDICVELGLLPPQELAAAHRGREALEGALAEYLQRRGHWPEGVEAGSLQGLTQGTLDWLAQSDARIALLNLEDLWLETAPQNVPGTGNERPNWRKKARYPMEAFGALDGVVRAFEAMRQHRSGGSQKDPKRSTRRRPPASPAPAPQPKAPSAPVGPWLSEEDLYLFNEGTHTRIYRKWGAHLREIDGARGVQFAVWAPNAQAVSVIGDFNGWDGSLHPLHPCGSSGVWEGFVEGVVPGAMYKYQLQAPSGELLQKADPVGFLHEKPPHTASHVWDLEYLWNDARWMAERHKRNALDAPMSIYELHLGSWMRSHDGRYLGYRKIAHQLASHVRDLGFTHVELLPVQEHPFYGSWGYQSTGYFAPSARWGTPQDLMYLIDTLHQYGIGVLLDWVPSHFPTDAHGLACFDGTHLYEHADPRQGYHPDWKSAIFNYGRHEVRSFLLSSAMFWLDHFHIDGLRVDAVASMLYLDYSRDEGEWIPNVHGGRENLEAIHFLRTLNQAVYGAYPDVQTIAEESTAWPQVSRPLESGGLGFGLKWDMGWMHDSLRYFQRPTVHRTHHHNELTFRSIYALHENFVLALSHDEVVHGKGSLLRKMPGDFWQKRANLRLLYAYMYGQTGKKHLFMGAELAMWEEWDHDGALPWHLLDDADHKGIYRWLQRLNQLYREQPALYERDFEPAGFDWIEANDDHHSVYAFLRTPRKLGASPVLAIYNCTPVVRHHYRLGVPRKGPWQVIANSDGLEYGGSDVKNPPQLHTADAPAHGQAQSIELTLPPLAALFLTHSH